MLEAQHKMESQRRLAEVTAEQAEHEAVAAAAQQEMARQVHLVERAA